MIRLLDYHVVAGGARCPQCQRRLCLRRGIRSGRVLRVLWFAAVLGMLPLFVLLAPLALLLLPLLVPLLLAIGPLNALVREPQRCALCHAVVELPAPPSAPAALPLGSARVIDLQRARRLMRRR
ncbi:MAG TPA: hypothetical protein VJR89_01435 [Polyangiales bacterium]|nr:hypothetical protein [Polyangiales bacterium]